MNLWGGRFSEKPSDALFALSRSVQFDWRLARYDLASSFAHLKGLHRSGVVNDSQFSSIAAAVKELSLEVSAGAFLPTMEDEDVHSALERGLTEKLGPDGGVLRAGRSRNDQIVTDLKLYLIENLAHLGLSVATLSQAFLERAREHSDVISPGFTHLQHAQPVSFGQELAKHSVALERDLSKIIDWFERNSLSPLGAGALAGSSLVLDPEKSAEELGFTSIAVNSIDAVSERDFVAEALFISAMIGVHLSRIGEEFILMSSTEFSWAKMADAYSTGSSIMPQKKNPDIAELARGKAGRFIGNLTALLTTLKGLPFAYNRDLQEDKEPIFDSLDNLSLLIPAITGMIKTVKFDPERISSLATSGHSLATEIADYLAKKSIPFARCHEIAGFAVKYCEEKNLALEELTQEDLKKIDPNLDEDLLSHLTAQYAVESRKASLGTNPDQVLARIDQLEKVIFDHIAFLSAKVKLMDRVLAL